MRAVSEPPVEALVALRSRWAKRVLTDDGAELRQIGRWLGVLLIDEDENGEPYFADLRCFRFTDELAAVEAFDALVAQESVS